MRKDHQRHWKAIRAVLDRWQPCGTRHVPPTGAARGAELICPAPHVAPEAWLHCLFPPLTPEDIARLEADLGRPLPSQLKEFYGCSNGMDVFSTALAVYGLRWNFARVGDEAWQPFDLGRAHRDYFGPSTEGFLWVGSYHWDGSRVAYPPGQSEGELVRVDRRTGEILATWPDFWTWLVSEVERLSTLFDEQGRPRDPSAPTV